MDFNNLLNVLVRKSTFSIQENNQKNISIGYHLEKQLEVTIVITCSKLKKFIILNPTQWKYLFSENIIQTIFNNMSTSFPSKKHFELDNNLHYKINFKTDSICLTANNNYISLNRTDLIRLTTLNNVINALLQEKENKLEMFQKCYTWLLNIFQYELIDFPFKMTYYIASHIRDYKINLENKTDEEKSFLMELQHLGNIVLARLFSNDE